MTAMLTEPSALTRSDYVLAAGTAFHPQRRKPIKAIVMHVTAGLQDLGLVGTDESAEGTNKWALNSGARVSWHRISDTDGVERCLPSKAVAWHASGYNSSTAGLEISNRDAKWLNKPARWVTLTLWHAARAVADWVVKYKIPLRRATRAELDRAIATNGAPVGFVDHSRLSDMRVDPGAEFPWSRFFGYVKQVIAGYVGPDVKPNTTPTPAAPVAKKEITVFALVQVRGLAPVYKSDGFRRQHIGKAQLAGLKKSGLKVIELANQTELDAYGVLEPNPAGQK